MTVTFAIGQDDSAGSGTANIGKAFINVIVPCNGEFLDCHGYYPIQQIMWGLEIYEECCDFSLSISSNFSSRSAISALAFPGG